LLCGLLPSRIVRFAPECIVFGGPLIKLGLTLGKLALQIGDNLVEIG